MTVETQLSMLMWGAWTATLAAAWKQDPVLCAIGSLVFAALLRIAGFQVWP